MIIQLILIALQIESQGFSLIQKIADPILAILIFSLMTAVFILWKSSREKSDNISKLQDERITMLLNFQKDMQLVHDNEKRMMGEQHQNILTISDKTKDLISGIQQVLERYTEKSEESIELQRKNAELIRELGSNGNYRRGK